MEVRTAYIEKLEKEKDNAHCRKWRLWVRTTEGKRSRRFQGRYREAQAALASFRAEVESEVRCSDSFAGYAESWVGYRESMGVVRRSTIKMERTCIRALCREFGDVALADITPERCREGLAAIKGGNNYYGRVVSGAYMNKLYVTFHRILTAAVADGRMARDPLAGVPAPKVDTREKAWLAPDELDALVSNLAALPPDGKALCYLMMCTLGLRRGEACALMVEDVDMARGIVHVCHGFDEASGGASDTKTSAGVRDLPMPPCMADAISRWLEVRTSRGWTCATLACNSRGTPMRPVDLEKWWLVHRAELGADGMTMHQLRHSNLSMMARHLNVFDLQRWAGWSSIEPARIYVHADDDSLRAGCADAFRHRFGTT